MRWLKVLVAGALIAGTMSLLPAVAAEAAPNALFAFSLGSGDTATAPVDGMMAKAGDWIKVKGSGTFDPTAETVSANGTFVHYGQDGAVICEGTWTATAFTGFQDLGRNKDGQEGGVLSLLVTHHCSTMAVTMTNLPMTLTSTANVPPGSDYVGGITVCDFTVPTGGRVVIEPEL